MAPIPAAWAEMPELLAALHARHPAAKMPLLGELPSAAGLRLLRHAPLCTYLGWDVMLPDSIWPLLRSALTLDLRIASTSLVRHYPLNLEPRPQVATPVVDQLEQDVLIWLAMGLTKKLIAAGLRTTRGPSTASSVKLRERFDVATNFELGAMAERLGLLADVQLGDAQQDLSHPELAGDAPRAAAAG